MPIIYNTCTSSIAGSRDAYAAHSLGGYTLMVTFANVRLEGNWRTFHTGRTSSGSPADPKSATGSVPRRSHRSAPTHADEPQYFHRTIVSDDGLTSLLHKEDSLIHRDRVARHLRLDPPCLKTVSKAALIVLDARTYCAATQDRADLLEILDDRVNTASTFIASQLLLETWHAYLVDPTLAEAIMDRLAHQSQRIELDLPGDSMHKSRVPTDA